MEKRKGFDKLLPQYKVDGLDPNDLLVKLEVNGADGTTKSFLYMEYAAARDWFFTVYPNGALVLFSLDIDGRKAVATAHIYRDVKDPMYAAAGVATRYYSEDDIGKNYITNAVTAAYRKGLKHLGFDVPQDAVEKEGIPVRKQDDLVMEGDLVSLPKPKLPVMEPDDAPADSANKPPLPALPKTDPEPSDAPANQPDSATAPAPKKRGRKSKAEKEAETAATAAPAAATAAPQEQPVEPAAQTGESASDGNKKPAPKFTGVPTLEQAKQYPFPYGSLAGKTIEEAAALKGKDFIRYHYSKAEGDFKAALAVYCEYYGC